MSRWVHITAACAALLIVAPVSNAFDAASTPIKAQGTVQVAFAPWDNVEGLIIDEIDGAKKQILLQAYLFTSKKIAAALIAAKQRGVDVHVLADAKQHAKLASSKLHKLAAAGIFVRLESKYQNAHNKVIVIDAATPNATVITGSFNFTWAAQHKNAENILIVRQNPSLVSRYVLNWERHQQDAFLYTK